MNKLLALAVCASLVGASGCVGYTLKPERPASMPRSSDKPLPLTVGVELEQGGTSIDGTPPTGGVRSQMSATSSGIGPRFAEALGQAGVFERVVYPLAGAAQQGVDLVIRGRFDYGFRQDPMQGPKIILCVFTGLITGAIMSETSYHDASGLLSVRDLSGAEAKSYSEKVSVEAKSMVSMFAEISTGKEGPPAAVDNLVAKLVQDIVADRVFYARLRRAPPPERRELEADNSGEKPAAGAAQPWWK
jgi:hypothetical protein